MANSLWIYVTTNNDSWNYLGENVFAKDSISSRGIANLRVYDNNSPSMLEPDEYALHYDLPYKEENICTTLQYLGVNYLFITELLSGQYNYSVPDSVYVLPYHIYNLVAEYIGPPVQVGTKFDSKYVRVQAEIADKDGSNRRFVSLDEGKTLSHRWYNYTNGMYNGWIKTDFYSDDGQRFDDVQVTYNYGLECYLRPELYPNNTFDTITKAGDNEFTILYKTPVFEMTTTLIVPGYIKEEPPDTVVNVTATYTGQPIKKYDMYSQADVEVVVHYKDSSLDRVLLPNEFTVSTLTVTDIPRHICFARWQDPNSKEFYMPTFIVPVIYPLALYATYVGPYVYLGNQYNLDDIIVTIEYNDSTYDSRLTSAQYDVSDTVINKIGLNEFTVTSKLFKQDNLHANFTVPGIREVLSFKIRYQKDDYVPCYVSDPLDTSLFSVSVITCDENKENIQEYPLEYGTDIISLSNGSQYTCDYYFDDGIYVKHQGIHTKTIVYITPFGRWETKINIKGMPKPIKMDCVYIGQTKFTGDIVIKDEVEVYLTYVTDTITNTVSRELIDNEDWTFHDAPLVQAFGNGEITLVHLASGIKGKLVVPYIVRNSLDLRCWYEGVKIPVGQEFNKDDVRVFYRTKEGLTFLADTYDLLFLDSCVVLEEGWNFFKVRLRDHANRHAIGIFAVPGYKPFKQADTLNLQVIFHDDVRKIAMNVTEDFLEDLTTEDIVYINWYTFLDVVNKIHLYGTYTVTVPRDSGFSRIHDEDWEVTCLDNKTLSANVALTYKEEETWQQKKHLQNLWKMWWKTSL